MASPTGTALMPTHGSCLPLTDIVVFFPNLLIVFLVVKIDDVGFTAKEAIISSRTSLARRLREARAASAREASRRSR